MSANTSLRRPAGAPSGGAVDVDWHDRFFDLEAKYLALRKQLNGKENSDRLQRVQEQRAAQRARKGLAPVPERTQPSTSQSPLNRTEGNAGDDAAQIAERVARPQSAPAKAPAKGPQGTKRKTSPYASSARKVPAPAAKPSAVAAGKMASTAPPVLAPQPQQQAAARPGSPQKAPLGSPQKRPASASRGPKRNTDFYAYTPPSSAVTARSRSEDGHPQARAGGAGDTSYLQQPAHERGMPVDPVLSAHHVVPAVTSGSAGVPPDPMMVWGVEDKLVQHVQTNALLEMNQKLREKVGLADEAIKTLQHDLSVARSGNSTLNTRVDEARSDAHQLVRERDLAIQKLTNAEAQLRLLRDQQQSDLAARDQVQFQLENQIRELRAKVVFGSDTSDALSRDVKQLLNDGKAKDATIASLQSQVTIARADLSSIRTTSESMVLEMDSLTRQLANERKLHLAAQREVQLSAVHKDRIEELQRHVDTLQRDKSAFEHEHLRMLDSLANVHNEAMDRAVSEVKIRISELEGAAVHWERVAQLQFVELDAKNTAHRTCRDECNAAKEARDEMDQAAKALRAELKLAYAKLDVVWPNHRMEGENVDPERVAKAFSRAGGRADASMLARSLRRSMSQSGMGGMMSGRSAIAAMDLADSVVAETEPGSPMARAQSSALIRLGDDDDALTAFDRDAYIIELEDCNAELQLELQQQRIANELLSEQLAAAQGSTSATVAKLEKTVERREAALKGSESVLTRQADRIHFLEKQVATIKGRSVANNTSLCDLDGNVTVFEVFVGQLIAEDQSLARHADYQHAHYFLAIDFLLHETVVTRLQPGLNAFHDTTFSFAIPMDAVLLHYLQSRGLSVQLCRSRVAQVTQDATAVTPVLNDSSTAEFDVVAEGVAEIRGLLASEQLHSKRPQIIFHVSLFDARKKSGANEPDGPLIASVEASVVSRAPFSKPFVELVEAAGGAAVNDSDSSAPLVGTPLNASLGSVTATTGAGALIDVPAGGTPSRPSQAPPRSPGLRSSVLPGSPVNENVLAMEQIKSITFVIEKVKVGFNQPALPLLSAYYVLEALQSPNNTPEKKSQETPRVKDTGSCEHWTLPKSGTKPTHEQVFDTRAGTATFPVDSPSNLFALLREPWGVFCFEEDGDTSATIGESYWGVSIVPLEPILMKLAAELAAGAANGNRGKLEAEAELTAAVTGPRFGEKRGELFARVRVSTAAAPPRSMAQHPKGPKSGEPHPSAADAANVSVVSSAAAAPAAPAASAGGGKGTQPLVNTKAAPPPSGLAKKAAPPAPKILPRVGVQSAAPPPAASPSPKAPVAAAAVPAAPVAKTPVEVPSPAPAKTPPAPAPAAPAVPSPAPAASPAAKVAAPQPTAVQPSAAPVAPAVPATAPVATVPSQLAAAVSPPRAAVPVPAAGPVASPSPVATPAPAATAPVPQAPPKAAVAPPPKAGVSAPAGPPPGRSNIQAQPVATAEPQQQPQPEAPPQQPQQQVVSHTPPRQPPGGVAASTPERQAPPIPAAPTALPQKAPEVPPSSIVAGPPAPSVVSSAPTVASAPSPQKSLDREMMERQLGPAPTPPVPQQPPSAATPQQEQPQPPPQPPAAGQSPAEDAAPPAAELAPCPKCGRRFNPRSLVIHERSCKGAAAKGPARPGMAKQPAAGGPAQLVPCPTCSRRFLPSKLDAHVATCKGTGLPRRGTATPSEAEAIPQ